MITKTANLYLLKEAGITDDVLNYLSGLNQKRIDAGFTAGNLLSKLPVGSDENKEELRTQGARAFLRNHGGKRLAELNALKNSLIAKARSAKGSLGDLIAGADSKNLAIANRAAKDLYNKLPEGLQEALAYGN